MRQRIHRRRYMVTGLAIFLTIMAMLVAIPGHAAQPPHPGALSATMEWPAYGGDPGNTRYSAATAITPANVHMLHLAWSFSTGAATAGSFESTAIVADGHLFITTPGGDIYALDPATGRQLWSAAQQAGSGGNNRGVAYGDGKIYVATPDDRLVAYDAATGTQRWATPIVNPPSVFYESMAPLFDRGRVIIGISNGEQGARGFVAAYNARTGKQDWRFYTIPAPQQVGGKTWPPGPSYLSGGGPIWMTPAVDPTLNLIYVNIGNPTPDFLGRSRAGANLFSDSIVALHANTGRLAWYFQEVHHDLWDLDPASPSVLVTLQRGHQQIPALIQAGKTGWLYVLDRRTGKPLVPTPERKVPSGPAWQQVSPTQPEPQNQPFAPQCPAPGLYHREGCIFTPPVAQAMLIAPGTLGGSEWSPAAYSPQTGLAYIAANDYPVLRSALASFGDGLAFLPHLPYRGRLVGYNVAQGKIAWSVPLQGMAYGGSVVTASNVVFSAETPGSVEARDARTGRLLWHYTTTGGGDAAPSIFVVGRHEYLAVETGGISWLDKTQPGNLLVFTLR